MAAVATGAAAAATSYAAATAAAARHRVAAAAVRGKGWRADVADQRSHVLVPRILFRSRLQDRRVQKGVLRTCALSWDFTKRLRAQGAGACGTYRARRQEGGRTVEPKETTGEQSNNPPMEAVTWRTSPPDPSVYSPRCAPNASSCTIFSPPWFGEGSDHHDSNLTNVKGGTTPALLGERRSSTHLPELLDELFELAVPSHTRFEERQNLLRRPTRS